MRAMVNPRYDLAIRSLLCGTSLGRPLSSNAVRRMIGDDDLSGFLAYVPSCPVGKFFKVLSDGRSIMMGVSSRALIAADSPLSGQSLAVFLYIWKSYNDNSMPVPRASVVEHFVSSERSAARSVGRAIEDLKRVCWIDEAAASSAADDRPGAGYAYIPTSAGAQSLGPKFLGKVIAESQGREFRPKEVSEFFQTPSRDTKTEYLQVSLFEVAGPEPKYERAVRKIIVRTASSHPVTQTALMRELGEDSLDGLREYWVGAGLDGYLRLTLYNDRVMALVDSEKSYQAGSGPLTAAAIAIATYIWHLEKSTGRWVTRKDLLPLVLGRAKEPGKNLARTLTLLWKKGWVKRKPDAGVRMTLAGEACLGLALDLRLDCNVPAMLNEFVESHLVPAIKTAQELAAAEITDEAAKGSDDEAGGEPDDPA